MKIRLERDVLAEAVAWVARSVPTRPAVPILAGLMMRATHEGVVLSSYDYDTSARVKVTADVSDEGEVLVSGRLLSDICRSLPNKPVEITADDSRVELVCGSARFTLQTLPLAEYPALPSMPEAAGTVSSADFAEAVSQVVVAAGRDELLAIFTAVRLEIDGETMTLLATDRYRMALKELTWNPSPRVSPQSNALVPARVLAETAKSLTAGADVTVSLAVDGSADGLIGFEGTGPGGVRETTTGLLDGEFPKVRHVMNIDPKVTVRAETAELIAAVKRVALVAERNTALRMLVNSEDIILEAATGDQAQASERIPATVINHSDEEQPIRAAGFNPSYLLDALGAIDAPFADFSFTAETKPCLIMGLKDIEGDPIPDYRHVIMLMRLPATGR